MLKKILGFLLIVITALMTLGCKGEYYKSESVVFSGSMVFSAQLKGGNEKQAVYEMESFLTSMDEIFNANIASSEISRFNESEPCVEVEVSTHLYDLANEAKRIYELTDGAFNPALSYISKAWGVDKEGIAKYCYGGEKMSALPAYYDLTALKNDTDLSLLTLSAHDGKLYMTKGSNGFRLDLGGIAKGYCADQLKKIAVRNGVKSGILSISGNLVLIGKNDDGDKWSVGVNNPRPENHDGQYVCGFKEEDKSVVTSGDYERYHYFGSGEDAIKICHIIDGRTLLPIGVEIVDDGYKNTQSYVISATVIGESSMLCDAYATALCVMSPSKSASFLNSLVFEGYKGVIFTSDGKYAVVGEMEMVESVSLYKTAYEQL